MNNHYSFIGGIEGPWRVTSCQAVVGASLETVRRINVLNVPSANLAERGSWVLQGFTSNLRYAERHEVNQLRAKQEGLNNITAYLFIKSTLAIKFCGITRVNFFI